MIDDVFDFSSESLEVPPRRLASKLAVELDFEYPPKKVKPLCRSGHSGFLLTDSHAPISKELLDPFKNCACVILRFEDEHHVIGIAHGLVDILYPV